MRQTRTVFRFSRYLRSTAAALCAGALAGCASTAPPSPEAALVERAAQYLAARQAGDVDTAYSLLAPSQRAVRSKEQFVSAEGQRIVLKDGALHSITCEPKRCTLLRRFSSAIPIPQIGKNLVTTSYVEEIWVQEDRKWWMALPE